MEVRRLGRTGLEVSELCLGTMTFGWGADKETTFAILDRAFDAGMTFLDTADVYSNWADNNPGGVAETWIGEWLKTKDRRQVVIATKVRGRMWDGPNGEGLSRAHIMGAVEDSLRRLDTEYIDLYQSHWYDANTPVEETMRAYDDLVRQGKVRYVGCSNTPAWRLVKALWASDANGLVRYESLQPHYNLVHRAEFEDDLKPVCEEEGLGVIPYSPLAGGFLTEKYRGGSIPEGTRGATSGRIREYADDAEKVALLDAMAAIGGDYGKTIPQVALGWLLSQPVITAPIVGARTVEQLEELLGAVGFRLPDEAMQRLDEASGGGE
jgi:aryl-alcohol dehydrogenase-like predicted oxidoreductase